YNARKESNIMTGRSKRGFATMGAQKQREIARRGGQTAHKKGTAHEFTPDEAHIAGHRGGKVVSSNRQYMAEIGRKGGQNFRWRTAKAHHTPEGNDGSEHGNGRVGRKNAGPVSKATELIRTDHRKVEELFLQYVASGDQHSQSETLVKQVCQELEIHARLEEEIFYPAVQAALDEEGQRLVTRALHEHKTVKDLIAQLKSMTSDDPSWDNTMQDLMERVRHHVEEEETEMLPTVEKYLRNQLESLGTQMQQQKQQLEGTAQDAAEAEMPEHPMQYTD